MKRKDVIKIFGIVAFIAALFTVLLKGKRKADRARALKNVSSYTESYQNGPIRCEISLFRDPSNERNFIKSVEVTDETLSSPDEYLEIDAMPATAKDLSILANILTKDRGSIICEKDGRFTKHTIVILDVSGSTCEFHGVKTVFGKQMEKKLEDLVLPEEEDDNYVSLN